MTNSRLVVPAQPVDATPSNALIRQCFPGRSDLFGCPRSKPSQGSVPADLTLASDLAFVFNASRVRLECCVDPLRPPNLSGATSKTCSYLGALGPARKPPSRTRDWPVMKEAPSEHIHTTAAAISSGLPKRPMGCRPSANFFASGAPQRRSPIGVSITAGHTTFTRMPLRAVSSAADLVSAMTPCLLAQ